MGVEGGEDRDLGGGGGSDRVNGYIRHLFWSCGSSCGHKEGVKREK